MKLLSDLIASRHHWETTRSVESVVICFEPGLISFVVLSQLEQRVSYVFELSEFLDSAFSLDGWGNVC